MIFNYNIRYVGYILFYFYGFIDLGLKFNNQIVPNRRIISDETARWF